MKQGNLVALRNLLHISYGQICTYLECSLKYQFQYVEKRAPERASITLFFGSSMHKCLERYYTTLKLAGVPEQLSILTELFAEKMTIDLTSQKVPIIFKKETPDLETAIELGCSLLETFYNSIDMVGMEILGVELPLSTMITDDINLVGSIDLLLLDSQTQNLIVVDTKTAAKAKTQADVDNDLQFSGYSHLLVENGFASKSDFTLCRLDVLRKLKTPKLEYYYTTRNLWQRKRFSRIAKAVLAGIEHRVFIPTRSWLCSDCQFSNACAGWR